MNTKTVVARFSFSEQASSAALLMSANSEGVTFYAEEDQSVPGTFVVVTEAEEKKSHADRFAEALNEKFKDAGEFASKYFSVYPGKRYDKIVQKSEPKGYSGSVHAFVEKKSGFVFKAASWNAPAKGVRFTSVEAAIEAADMHGFYLYAK